jgi:hypothetical protein
MSAPATWVLEYTDDPRRADDAIVHADVVAIYNADAAVAGWRATRHGFAVTLDCLDEPVRATGRRLVYDAAGSPTGPEGQRPLLEHLFGDRVAALA